MASCSKSNLIRHFCKVAAPIIASSLKPAPIKIHRLIKYHEYKNQDGLPG